MKQTAMSKTKAKSKKPKSKKQKTVLSSFAQLKEAWHRYWMKEAEPLNQWAIE